MHKTKYFDFLLFKKTKLYFIQKKKKESKRFSQLKSNKLYGFTDNHRIMVLKGLATVARTGQKTLVFKENP